MLLVRDLVFTSLNYNILFRARHIAGVHNSRADLLSRFQVNQFKRNLSGGGRNADSSTRPPSAEELVASLNDLLSSALSAGSRKLYSRAWTVFREFYARFVSPNSFSLPVTTTTIVLFVSYLRARKLAPSTISSYLSAISYVHKMQGLRDPTKTFLIQKLLTAVGRERSPDSRLPITKPVLFQLVRSLQHTLSSAEQRILFTAVFNSLLRIFSHRRTGEQRAMVPATQSFNSIISLFYPRTVASNLLR